MSLKQKAIAVDQLINTFIRGGMADETISARAWRNRDAGWGIFVRLVNTLFFWQDNHCKSAYEAEVARKQLPEEYQHL